jgi:hypothetical protein
MALFFKFSRLLSFRNLDVLTLPLLVPGLLLLRESDGNNWYGYLWLIGGSLYFLTRCLIDLSLVSRPALKPNLSPGGLAWLAGALFVCMITVAVRDPQKGSTDRSANTTAIVNKVEQGTTEFIQQQAGADTAMKFDAPFWVPRTLALACHLAVVLGLVFVGGWHFQSWHTGVAAATFYLLLPYTALDVAQWHHVWPAALLVWAVACYRKPTLAGVLVGLACGTTYFPVVTLPVWLSFYWRRGVGRFTGAAGLAGGLCLAVTVCTLWLGGDLARSVQYLLALPDWQAWREPIHGTKGLWKDLHWAYRMPVFVAYLTLVLTMAFWPSPKNLAHLLALSTTAVIGIQFWYADQGGVYILWYLPLLLLVVFRPNLSDRVPLPIQRETDWLNRLGHALGRFALRLLRLPEPVVRVR